MGAAVVFWSRRRRAPLLFALALHLPMVAVAQSSCTRNGNGNCRIGNNATCAITIRTTQGTWTASPAPARPNKPSGDLQWGTAAGGPFADFTTTAVTAATGAAATAGRVVPRFFRLHPTHRHVALTRATIARERRYGVRASSDSISVSIFFACASTATCVLLGR